MMIPHRSPEQSRSEPPGFSFLEYDKAREKIPESTRASVDTWRDEILEICRAHSVDHPNKLVLAKTHASSETLERVQNLLDDILYVFEHQDLPPEKKENLIDDREYAVEFYCEKNPSDEIVVQNLHGRFYFLEGSTDPASVYAHTGENWKLPEHVSSSAFALLGSHLVLIAQRNDEKPWGISRPFLADLHGDPLASIPDFSYYEKVGDSLVSVGKTPRTWHPVGKDGIIREKITFGNEGEEDTKFLKTVLIAGHPYFFEFNKNWMIYTEDKRLVGDPDGYEHKPLLCEEDGELRILVHDLKLDEWSITDEQGNFVRELKTPPNMRVHTASIVQHTCLVGAKQRDSIILFDEHGTILWDRFSPGTIQQIIPRGSTFIFSTIDRVSDPAIDREHTIISFHGSKGEDLASYRDSCDVPPICVGTTHAYFSQDDLVGHRLDLRFSNDRIVTLGAFLKIYAMEAIDEYRFYVIGLEQKKDTTYRIVKRVYDVRKIKAPSKKFV